jgi:hypothetical protein
MKYFIGIIIILFTTSCSSVDIPANVRVGSIKEIELMISNDTVIDLDVFAGNVHIESSPDEQLRAEMTAECPSRNDECAERMADLDFVSLTKGKHLTLRTNRDSFLQHYNAALRVKFYIPKSKQLNVKMDAGELSVNNIDSCLNVEMSAGEINIKMPYSMFASIELDTLFGEASLNVNGLNQKESRAWLVGGEVSWNLGIGSCQMKVDLHAGEISVNIAD